MITLPPGPRLPLRGPDWPIRWLPGRLAIVSKGRPLNLRGCLANTVPLERSGTLLGVEPGSLEASRGRRRGRAESSGSGLRAPDLLHLVDLISLGDVFGVALACAWINEYAKVRLDFQ
jgi:hypothetical protein